ncbi:MAG: hypothetical protein GXZ01_07060 [Clostridiaceae bacterium]|nr:hypothetical protein [Clostridiaceae bacterium]
MEQLRSGWDLFLLPREWHRRLNESLVSLVPGFAVVGFFNILCHSRSILVDFILGSTASVFEKTLLFIIAIFLIGFLDVFCFAWPIADLCKYLAKRSNKFIMKGFNIILMKSYAYSHLVFYPVILIVNPTGFEVERLYQEITPATKFVIITLYVWALLQAVIQPGILLRTVSIKSKLDLGEKILVALVMFLWMNLEAQAIGYVLDLNYNMFATLFKLV